jgi:hypothetical protein
VVEEIPGEWAVLKAGEMELALHLVGPQYRRDAPDAGDTPLEDADGTATNAKLVFQYSPDCWTCAKGCWLPA